MIFKYLRLNLVIVYGLGRALLNSKSNPEDFVYIYMQDCFVIDFRILDNYKAQEEATISHRSYLYLIENKGCVIISF